MSAPCLSVRMFFFRNTFFLSRASKPIYKTEGPQPVAGPMWTRVKWPEGPRRPWSIQKRWYHEGKNMFILFLKMLMFWTVLVNLAGLGVCLSAQTIFIINSIWILVRSIWNSLQLNWVLFNLIQSNLHRKLNPNPLSINLIFTGFQFEASYQ